MKKIINLAKKYLAAVMAVSMVFTAVPLSTFATEQQSETENDLNVTVSVILDDGEEKSLDDYNDNSTETLIVNFSEGTVDGDDSYVRLEAHFESMGSHAIKGVYIGPKEDNNMIAPENGSISCNVKKMDVKGKKIIIDLKTAANSPVDLRVDHSSENKLELNRVTLNVMGEIISSNSIPSTGMTVNTNSYLYVTIDSADYDNYVYELTLNDKPMTYYEGFSNVYSGYVGYDESYIIKYIVKRIEKPYENDKFFTLNPNGGVFPKEVLEAEKNHIVTRNETTGAISFGYWKDDVNGACGYSIGSTKDIKPVKEGYDFLGFFEKNEDGTPNLEKKFVYPKLTSEEQFVDVEYIAGWAKSLPVINEKNIVTDTVEGRYIRTAFHYDKEELKSLYDAEKEVLLVLYESWTKVPNDRNDEIDKNGNYANWNAAPVDFDYNPFVFAREMYNNPVEYDTDVWIRYKYVVIKKDPVNNPNNYILNRWSSDNNIIREASTWSENFKDTFRNEKSAAGGDIVEEDTRYDNVKTVTRKELTASNTQINDIKIQTYNGTYLKPTVSVKFKENADAKAVTLVEGTDYIKTYENCLNAGTAKVIIKGNGLYKGTVEKTYAIAPKKATKLKITVGAVKVGDSTAVLLADDFVSVFDGTTKLTKDVDYTIDTSRVDLSKKGKTYIYLKGKNNYSDDEVKAAVNVIELAEGQELIRTANLKSGVSANLIYKGSAHGFTQDQFEVSTETRVLDTTEYTVSAKNVKDVGTGYITIKPKNRKVKGSLVIPVEILPAPGISFDIVNGDNVRAVNFNGKLQRPKVKVTAVNPTTKRTITLKQNKDYKIIYANNIHATNGEKAAEIKIVGIGNYETADTKIAKFEIKPISITKAKASGVKGDIKLVFNKHEIVKDVDYILSDWEDKSATKSSVTIKGKEGGDFIGEVIKTFRIPAAQ